MKSSLPKFLRGQIGSPPQAGEGVHSWLFRTARQLHAHYSNKEEMAELLAAAVAGCGRNVSRREIEDAIAHSASCAWQLGVHTGLARPRPWPERDNHRVETILQNGRGLADLWEASNVTIADNHQHTECVIDLLFPGNPLLCCGATQSDFDTQTREIWRNKLRRLQFIVPSPMTSVFGQTKDGRPSKHTLANTGPRRFLVCEFDQGTTDTHAALLLHLGGFAPLVCVVHSGGKSLHGWFLVEGQLEDRVHKFFRYAVSLGADPHTWTRSQFVRMPDGTRDTGCRQTVYYLNPNPLKTP